MLTEWVLDLISGMATTDITSLAYAREISAKASSTRSVSSCCEKARSYPSDVPVSLVSRLIFRSSVSIAAMFLLQSAPPEPKPWGFGALLQSGCAGLKAQVSHLAEGRLRNLVLNKTGYGRC